LRKKKSKNSPFEGGRAIRIPPVAGFSEAYYIAGELKKELLLS
jgi:hypothetical protein